MAVPLWDQYTVVARNLSIAGKWIVVSNYEQWVMQLIDAVTPKCVRAIAKRLSDKIKVEFQACLAKARRATSLADPFDPKSIDDKVKLPSGRFEVEAALVINIGGHNVTCINHASRMVLKLDAATAQFISDWVVPLVNKMALSQALPTSLSDAGACGTLANFQMIASPTPNIRDKVQWNPSRHIWEIVVKKSKGGEVDAGQFRVDTTLSPVLYEQEKKEAYRRAIDTWNQLDGSTRHRIGDSKCGVLAADIE